MKPSAKAFLTATAIFGGSIGAIVAYVFLFETPSHVASFKRHVFDIDNWPSYTLILLLYLLTAALLEFALKRKAKREQEEKDRAEEKASREKLNKVLDMQMEELERRKRELDERERKIAEKE